MFFLHLIAFEFAHYTSTRQKIYCWLLPFKHSYGFGFRIESK